MLYFYFSGVFCWYCYIPCLLLIITFSLTCGKTFDQNFFFFMSLLTVSIGQSYFGRNFFIFLKNTPHQTGKACNTKSGSEWNDQKSSYQVRQVLTLFCISETLITKTVLQFLDVIKIVKQTKFKGAGGELEVKTCFQIHSWTE